MSHSFDQYWSPLECMSGSHAHARQTPVPGVPRSYALARICDILRLDGTVCLT